MIEVLESVERNVCLGDRLAFIWTRRQWCVRPAQVPLIKETRRRSLYAARIIHHSKSKRQLCNMANMSYCAAEVVQLCQTRHSLQAR